MKQKAIKNSVLGRRHRDHDCVPKKRPTETEIQSLLNEFAVLGWQRSCGASLVGFTRNLMYQGKVFIEVFYQRLSSANGGEAAVVAQRNLTGSWLNYTPDQEGKACSLSGSLAFTHAVTKHFPLVGIDQNIFDFYLISVVTMAIWCYAAFSIAFVLFVFQITSILKILVDFFGFRGQFLLSHFDSNQLILAFFDLIRFSPLHLNVKMKSQSVYQVFEHYFLLTQISGYVNIFSKYPTCHCKFILTM